MAERQTSKGFITDTTGVVVGVMAPGSESGGYADKNITRENLVKPESDRISQVEGDLSALSTVVSQINADTKIVVLNATTSYTFTMPANSVILTMAFLRVEDTVLKVGITAGGSEIIPATTLTASNRISYQTTDYPFYANTTVYVTITSGKAHITRFIRSNLFT